MIELPSGIKIKDLINDLRILSWEVSDTLIYYSKILKDPNNKSNILKNNNLDDPVTLADLKVNEIIIKRINEKYRDASWGILSEENAKANSFNSYCSHDWMWVLDPLDGTKDFIQGTRNYAMHLALNYKSRPYIGIVLIPEKDELWIADGKKVWGEKRDGSIIKPNLSKNIILQDMTLVTSKNHRNPTLRNLIEKIDFKEVIIMGSIGCKIASILRGQSDIYICLSMPEGSSPKDWDFAAPEAILKAAGGAITNIYNEELVYGASNFRQGGIIVASNNCINQMKICSEIRQILEKYNLYQVSS